MVQTGAADDATRIAAALEGLHKSFGVYSEFIYGRWEVVLTEKDSPYVERSFQGDTFLEALERAAHAKTAGEG
jgi:hypothetical protein